MEDVRNVLDVDDVAVGIQHFHEAAHVRAFEFFWQVHKHPNGRHRVLDAARLVVNLNGETQAAHAHFINPQLAVIAFALLIVQF